MNKKKIKKINKKIKHNFNKLNKNLEDYKKQISAEFEELDRGILMDFIRRFDELESNIKNLEKNTL